MVEQVEKTEVDRAIIDAREIHFSSRYLEVMRAIEKLEVGGEVLFISPHNPKALIYAIQWEHPERFSFSMSEKPDTWELLIKRIK
jgi:uncharacterized protein (DUF2249 family)